MKNLLLRSVSLLPLIIAWQADAANLALKAPAKAPVPPTWSGFYIGGNVGGAWGQSNAATTASCVPPGGFPGYFCNTGSGAANAAAIAASGTGSINANNPTGGGQIGFNWQSGTIVYGLEADADAMHLGGSRQASGGYPTSFFPATTFATQYTVGSSFSTDWLVTARARLGFLISPALLAYATGGLAVTSLNVTNSFVDNNGNFPVAGSGSGRKTVNGWVVGGGLEAALGAHWSAKAEFLYAKFGSATANAVVFPRFASGYANAISTSADLAVETARVGLNYRF